MVAERPGASSGVFFPAILKSCETLPLFVTLKITLPVGALRFDSVNLWSVAVTVTWFVAVRWVVACEALGLAPPPGTRTPAASPATVSGASRTTLPRRMGNPSSEAFIRVRAMVSRAG